MIELGYPEPIEIESKYTVDWENLGYSLAYMGSDEQAQFVEGLVGGFKSLDGQHSTHISDTQLFSAADELDDECKEFLIAALEDLTGRRIK